jgi:putative lipoic acid-binding regulatory protein
MDNRPSLELLEANHQFPGMYRIKAIGAAGDQFVERVVAAASDELGGPGVLTYSVRLTSGGRHAAVTLDMTVQTAAQVRAIYAAIGAVGGLVLLL